MLKETIEINYINKKTPIYIEDIDWKKAKKQKEFFSEDSLCANIFNKWIVDCEKCYIEKSAYDMLKAFSLLGMGLAFFSPLIIPRYFPYNLIIILFISIPLIFYFYAEYQLRKKMNINTFGLHLTGYETDYISSYFIDNPKRYDVSLNGIFQENAYVSIYDIEIKIALYSMYPKVAKRINESKVVSVSEYLILIDGVLRKCILLDLE